MKMVSMSQRAARSLGICFLLIFASGGVAFSQQARVKPVQQVMVVDSKGKTVGHAVGGLISDNMDPHIPNLGDVYTIRATVLLQVDQYLVPVGVARDRFYGVKFLGFESPNCEGTPWLYVPDQPDDPADLLPRVAIAPPGNTIYMSEPGTAPRNTSFESVMQGAFACQNSNYSFPAVPTQPLVDLLTVFTPPFSMRAVHNPAQADVRQRSVPDRERNTE